MTGHWSRAAIRWTDCQHYIELYPPEPFSFHTTLGYFMRAANECMFQVEDRSVTRLVPGSDSRPLLVRVSEQPGGDGAALRICFPGSPVPPAEADRIAAAQYIWEWFDLDTNLRPFYDMAEQDPLLSPAIRQFRGLRIVGIADLFEAMSWGIIGQQINLPFAYTLKRRLVEAYGQAVQLHDRTYWTFPSPDRITRLSVEELMELKLTRGKSEYMIGTAKLIAEGALSKERLSALPDVHSAEKELTRIRGIGPWTANYVLMRCLRFPTAFPIADVGLHNAIKHVQGLDRKPTLEEIRQFSSGWAGWEAYATFYLWRVLY